MVFRRIQPTHSQRPWSPLRRHRLGKLCNGWCGTTATTYNQPLAQYRDSLALVVGLMGQRFGSPTGTHESGSEEEFEWALHSYLQTGFPEIKWFFRTVEQFVAPSADVKEIQVALEQWTKVQSFKERLQHGKPRRGQPPLFHKEFTDTEHFREVLRHDLSLWLAAPERPWS